MSSERPRRRHPQRIRGERCHGWGSFISRRVENLPLSVGPSIYNAVVPRPEQHSFGCLEMYMFYVFRSFILVQESTTRLSQGHR